MARIGLIPGGSGRPTRVSGAFFEPSAASAPERVAIATSSCSVSLFWRCRSRSWKRSIAACRNSITVTARSKSASAAATGSGMLSSAYRAAPWSRTSRSTCRSRGRARLSARLHRRETAAKQRVVVAFGGQAPAALLRFELTWISGASCLFVAGPVPQARSRRCDRVSRVRKKPVAVGHDLVRGEEPVMVPVGLLEPVCKRVVGGRVGTKRFSHRADERRPCWPVTTTDRHRRRRQLWPGISVQHSGHSPGTPAAHLERVMKMHMNLHGASSSPICAPGSRRTALSPTWSGPEGSSHNDFVPGRRLPPLAMASHTS